MTTTMEKIFKRMGYAPYPPSVPTPEEELRAKIKKMKRMDPNPPPGFGRIAVVIPPTLWLPEDDLEGIIATHNGWLESDIDMCKMIKYKEASVLIMDVKLQRRNFVAEKGLGRISVYIHRKKFIDMVPLSATEKELSEIGYDGPVFKRHKLPWLTWSLID